jgi:hypothetical protein
MATALNKAREQWVREADECAAHNLAELDKRADKHLPLESTDLFKRFCFTVQVDWTFNNTLSFKHRLLSTDTYLTPGQVLCLRSVAHIRHPKSHAHAIQQLTPHEQPVHTFRGHQDKYSSKDIYAMQCFNLNYKVGQVAFSYHLASIFFQICCAC